MINKKGFTLIELLVVISIIGILALMGLRFYLTQQDKAKKAVVKGNAGTIQTLIQANMADINYDDATPAARITAALGDIIDAAGCHNPYTNGTGNINVIKASGETLIDGNDTDYGKIAIASSNINEFKLQGLDQNGKLFGIELQAKK